ncbi:hypothetical protein CKO15_06940 [Halorhodospira abdelmalekii]|uniref:type II toxin-antitoxin system RelE family toxin n=1 Tax=Halorhodospira abdelmalekii TaxID=421629 RepID=UPI003B84B610|nr:hypothetical protein [Halorhodospira abdelmalekii]
MRLLFPAPGRGYFFGQLGVRADCSYHPGYRLRIGDWRVVYTVSDETVTVHVIRIAPRGGAY